ncbi:MAG: hypothetical protein BWK75_01830 [Candidatus Altiarchaeales archaeon A3]|nr:MAG: hypothetical protein BWK75_01830 [Candidatus Altiarchaeales archaeon A3]
MNNNILNFFKWKDVFSLLCAVFGFFAIIEVFTGNFLIATLFLGLAGISDYMDGFMARKFSFPTEYGANIDTVADAVAFGVAPAVFIYFYGGNYLYLLISIIVMCAGLMRLARYLCLSKESENQKGTKVYVGMPITFNAIIIPLLYLLSEYLNFNLFFLTLISAYLMISTINFRKI